MNIQHEELAAGKWLSLTFAEQMANIGSEVERAISWRKKNNLDYSQQAFYRSLELLDLTLNCLKQFSKLKETTRLREALVDYFVFDNSYKSTDEQWQKYFLAFNYAARINHC